MFSENWSRKTVLTEKSTPLESTNRETQILQHLVVQIYIEILVKAPPPPRAIRVGLLP